jgi:P27 family predicted phage terminase small subunit
MRGRKPKPTRQKRLEGNPGKRRMPTDEPTPPATPAPLLTAPVELQANARARAEWDRLAPMLYRIRLATNADRSALVALCLEWARYLDATERIATLGLIIPTPSGYPMPNPYLAIATKALASCTKLWPELGLTPSSRSRLSTPGDGPGPAGDDFSEFDAPAPWDTTRH